MAAEGVARAPETGASRWLALEGIHHAYDAAPVVKGVDLVVGPGEIMCLLGPSGCGKTTLLRIAAGLERQSAGRVLIDGEEVAGPHRFVAPEKRRIGLMFQDYALFPHVRAIDNVGFGLTATPRAERRRVAFAMLERLGLAALANAYPHELSGGEQQRVALARALAPAPRAMLLDEPFSGLDERLREQVRDDTLRFLHEAGVPIVLVTHDADEALQMADQIALMRDGCWSRWAARTSSAASRRARSSRASSARSRPSTAGSRTARWRRPSAAHPPAAARVARCGSTPDPRPWSW